MKRVLPFLLSLVTLSLFAADDLERTISMMARVGSAGSPVFSPDGKRIAFLTGISGSPQVWMVSSDGGWPDQITALDDPVADLDWSPDGRWLAIQVAPGGGLNTQIYVVRPDGTGLRQLTEGGKTNNWLGAWTPDSKALVISSNRAGADMDTWLLDVGSGKMTLIAKNPGIGTYADVSRDGKFVMINRVRARGDNDVYRVATDGSSEVHLTKHAPPAEFGGARFAGASDDVIYVGGNPERDRSAFGRIVVKDGKPGPFEVLVARDDAELGGLVLDRQGAVAVLNWNVAGRNELAFVDLRTMQSRPAPKLPGDIVGVWRFSDDGSKLALTIAGSNAPQDIYVLDTRTNALTQVTRSPHAGVDLSQLVRPELVTYESDDGLTLTGWLYRPRNAQAPYATVLSFHGGPESQERPTFNSTYQALVASGIAVFAPNVRGSAGFGKKFVNLDNAALRVGSIRDIKATADHLVTAGISDPRRLGIMGGSYGGYMVMAGVTEYPELFAAGANLFGMINLETFFQHTEPWMAAVSKSEYGDPDTQRDLLKALSPINKVDRIRTPLLVLHGANDTNVPVIEAEQTVASLRQRNVPVEYILFPDEGHGWRKTANRIRSTTAIVKWFSDRLNAPRAPQG